MTTITPAALAKFVRAVPDALRPTWLDETWSGVHGAGGLRADVTNVSSELLLTSHGITGSSLAKGSISDSAARVGQFTREQTLHEGGRLEVHHSLLELAPEAQGSGFSRAFNERAFARYADAGVDDVTINAGSTVGGYAWARQGFELAGSGSTDVERLVSRARKLSGFVDEARAAGRISEEQFEQVAPRLHRRGDLRPDALVSVQELAAMPDIGKPVLLGRNWYGRKPIEHAQAWWAERTPGGVDAARTGVGSLTPPVGAMTGRGAAARRIGAQLPAALDPSRAPQVFEHTFAGAGRGAVGDGASGAALTVQLRAGDEVSRISNSFGLQVGSRGVIRLKVELDASGELVGSEFMSPTLRVPATRHALDSAWRDLGIEHVMDGSPGSGSRIVGRG